MRLVEFTNPKLSKIIAITDALDQALISGQIKTNWTLDMLSEYFRKFDLVLSDDDFYDMITTKPLNKIIKNIEGNQVIFRGLQAQNKRDDMVTPKKSKEIVAKMAKKTLSK